MAHALYTAMVSSLTNATHTIHKLLAGHKLSDEQWETYVGSAHALRNNLIHLNGIIHAEYSFEEGLPHDLLNYQQLLLQYNQPLEELVSYLLDRQEMFGDLYKYETMFLTEVLDGATFHAGIIAGLVK